MCSSPRGTPTDPTRDAEQAVREGLPPFLPPMPSLKDLRGLVVMMVEDYEDDELFGSAAIVDALITAVRQAERARIRGIVEGVAVCYGGFQRNPSAVKADILAALSSEGT